MAVDMEKKTELKLRDNYNLVKIIANKLIEDETISGDCIVELLDKETSNE